MPNNIMNKKINGTGVGEKLLFLKKYKCVIKNRFLCYIF